MSEPFLVEVPRDGFSESTHVVDAVVVGEDGTVIAEAGDSGRLAAFRSSSKPLQAAVSRSLGWKPETSAHLALACASHNGEPVHVGTARRILASAGLDESALGCPPAWPYRPADTAHAGRARAVAHNCSGKHAGFLAACVAAGLDTQTYLAPSHPLQAAIRERLEEAAGTPAVRVLTDGCGAPTFVFPLSAMARVFMAIREGEEADAMLAHPLLVAGTDRLDTAVLAAGVLTKAGAEGLSVAAGSVRTGDGPLPAGTAVAIAVKSRDGSIRGRSPVLVTILEQLGLVEAGAIDPASGFPPVLGAGRPVGVPAVHGRLEFR